MPAVLRNLATEGQRQRGRAVTTYCEHCGSPEERAHIKYYDKATGYPVYADRCSSRPCKTENCHHFVHVKAKERTHGFLCFSWTSSTWAHVACSKCGVKMNYGMAFS